MLGELERLSTSYAAYAFVVVLGLLWGSFANVCIYRWPPSEEFPRGRSIVKPGSHCFACKTPIRWYDNVPLLAWLWLRGKCRTCRAEFSPRYLIVEALTGALFGLAWWFIVAGMPVLWWHEPFDQRLVRFAIAAAFCFAMVVIAFIDLDTGHIYDKISIPSTLAFYGCSLLLPERTWYDGLIGAAVGYGFPWLVGEIYFRITRREGLGLGDSWMLAGIGALFGWKGVVVSLFGGSIIGSVVGTAALIAARRRHRAERAAHASQPAAEPVSEVDPAMPADREGDPSGEPSLMRTELPFGPFLAAAAVFYLFAEPWLQIRFVFFSGWG